MESSFQPDSSSRLAALPVQAVVTVDRAESVTFHEVFTAEGKAPIYNVNTSENVRY